jgi:hypothetical protein
MMKEAIWLSQKPYLISQKADGVVESELALGIRDLDYSSSFAAN